MNYNKKQMQPLIDKFQINVETNKLFEGVVNLFDGQSNYQVWAVKMVFGECMSFEDATFVKEWVAKNSNHIKTLDKQNVVSYSSKTAIQHMLKEMRGIDKVILISDVISHFNTDQKKLLTSHIFSREITPSEAYSDTSIDRVYKLFQRFKKIGMNRRNKFYSTSSAVRNAEEILNLMKSAIEDKYEWNKEDLLAFVANNTNAQVVYDKDNFVILHIDNFKDSKKLCGGGRTQWCLSREESYFKSYVTSKTGRSQYFMFDFSRKESDPFAHIGFTIEMGRGVVEAQTCDNKQMIHGYKSESGETMSMAQALEKAGASMSLFMRLPRPCPFDWTPQGFLGFIKSHQGLEIIFERDNRYIVRVCDNNAFYTLTGYTFLKKDYFNTDSTNQAFVLVDLNVANNDEKSMIALSYRKDMYGILTMSRVMNCFANDITKDGYLSRLGIKTDDFIDRTEIAPEILLHKLIDENDEVGAIELIEKEGNEFDVNYCFKQRVPVFSTIAQRMFNLFDTIVAHPKFDTGHKDGFGETLLHGLLYLYGSEEFNSNAGDDERLAGMIKTLLEIEKDYNVKDLNDDTALSIACEYPRLAWCVEYLCSKKEVDVNSPNTIFCTPLSVALRRKNMKAAELIGRRPDLVVTDEDRKVASAYNINLDDIVKPDASIFKESPAEASELAAALA